MRHWLLRPHQPIGIGRDLLVPPSPVIQRLGARPEHFRDATTTPYRRHDGPERIVIPGTDIDQDPHARTVANPKGAGQARGGA